MRKLTSYPSFHFVALKQSEYPNQEALDFFGEEAGSLAVFRAGNVYLLLPTGAGAAVSLVGVFLGTEIAVVEGLTLTGALRD